MSDDALFCERCGELSSCLNEDGLCGDCIALDVELDTFAEKARLAAKLAREWEP